MIRAPSSSSVSWGTPFTDATVPTGIKTGVSIWTCGEESLLRRAVPLVFSMWKKSAGMGKLILTCISVGRGDERIPFLSAHGGNPLRAVTPRFLRNPFVHSLLVTLGNHAVHDFQTYNWPCPEGHLPISRMTPPRPVP